jgi:hypothetical protein
MDCEPAIMTNLFFMHGSNQPRVESKDDCWGGGIGLIVRWKERKEKKKQNNNNAAFSIMQNTSNTQWQVFHLVNQVWLAREANYYEPLHFACCNASACTKVIDANRSHCFVWGLIQCSMWYQNDGPCSRWYWMLGCWIPGV